MAGSESTTGTTRRCAFASMSFGILILAAMRNKPAKFVRGDPPEQLEASERSPSAGRRDCDRTRLFGICTNDWRQCLLQSVGGRNAEIRT